MQSQLPLLQRGWCCLVPLCGTPGATVRHSRCHIIHVPDQMVCAHACIVAGMHTVTSPIVSLECHQLYTFCISCFTIHWMSVKFILSCASHILHFMFHNPLDVCQVHLIVCITHFAATVLPTSILWQTFLSCPPRNVRLHRG